MVCVDYGSLIEVAPPVTFDYSRLDLYSYGSMRGDAGGEADCAANVTSHITADVAQRVSDIVAEKNE